MHWHQIVGFDMVDDKIQINDFDVKPDGQLSHLEKEWLGFTCKFTYQVQGGTDEHWVMSMSMNEDQTKFYCSVERPSGSSYLFFQVFKLEVTGGTVEEAEVQGEGHKPLPAEEYVYDQTKNTIAQSAKFQNHLEKVALFAVRGKQEL